jgi:hypothetical protein
MIDNHSDRHSSERGACFRERGLDETRPLLLYGPMFIEGRCSKLARLGPARNQRGFGCHHVLLEEFDHKLRTSAQITLGILETTTELIAVSACSIGSSPKSPSFKLNSSAKFRTRSSPAVSTNLISIVRAMPTRVIGN